ncbi:MAG: hypothetical protein ACPGU6_02450 [Tenacibaculum sp.]
MKKIYILLFLLVISCNKNDVLKDEISDLKNKVQKLKKENLSLQKNTNELKKQLELSFKESIEKLSEVKANENLLKVLDSEVLIDTLDKGEDGINLVFKRKVDLFKVDKTFSADDLVTIDTILSFPGYKVFSICDGGSLNLESCNCTDSIYIIIEPEELGEYAEVYKSGLYFNLDLISVENENKEDYDSNILLRFKHGESPRKIKEIDLTQLKFNRNK